MVSKRASLYGENGKLLHQGAFDMEKKREKRELISFLKRVCKIVTLRSRVYMLKRQKRVKRYTHSNGITLFNVKITIILTFIEISRTVKGEAPKFFVN